MGIESGNFINDLNEDWPTATDNVSDGDNHLRLIKKVVKDSFPGVDRVSEYIYVHTSAPTVSVGKGRLWLDTSTTPNLLKIYDGSAFKKLPISATVDYKLMGNDTVGWVLPTADGTANYPLTTTGSNVLAFAQIDTAAIADNAVDGAKIAMGSDAAGDVLYHNGTDYVRLPKGAASEVLTVNSGATAPEWAAAATTTVVAGNNNFMCGIAGNQDIPTTSWTRLAIGGTTVYNNSSGQFNTTTGVFTAPATGLYHFSGAYVSNATHNCDDDIAIYRDSSIYATNTTYRQASGSYVVTLSTLTVSCDMYMTSGDTASLYARTEDASGFQITGSATGTWFSGYRIT
tara:strand:- start:4221 stop:5249 length:1029 start_codon:yes stop_codon:yes gene_type:complete